MSRRHTVLGGVLLVGALIGAACGGDDSDDAATTTTGSATTAAGATSTSAATATTAGKQPATWAEWEQDGAQRRAAVVKRIKDNKLGALGGRQDADRARGLDGRTSGPARRAGRTPRA